MSQPGLNLEMLAEHIRYSNPFEANRVTQTDSLRNDIPQIHADKFDELQDYARKAAKSKEQGYGVVITGTSGIGKSHLLARFGEWARQEKYPFIYLLNLQAGPDDILRTILRTSISILATAEPIQDSRLYRMVSVTINAALDALGIKPTSMPKLRQAYDKMLNDSMRNERSEDRLVLKSIYEVLWHFFEDVFGQANENRSSDGRAELVIRWLSGGYLEFAEAKRLKLAVRPNNEDGCTLDLGEMTMVLKVLCQFAGFRDRSLILCFDQVDNFRDDQIPVWLSLTHALLDRCPRLLVVTSGVEDTFLKWAHWLTIQNWESRIRQFYIRLSGIDADLALTMIRTRLQESLGPFAALSAIADKQKRDPLFPIGESWRKQTLLDEGGAAKKELRPRDVIHQACSAWSRESQRLQKAGAESWLHLWPDSEVPGSEPETKPINRTALIDEKVEEKVAEHRQTRLLRPEELPVDAGNVVGLLKSMLGACEGSQVPYRTEIYGRFQGLTLSKKSRTKSAFQMIVEHRSDCADGVPRKIGVAVADASTGLAATNMLKRMLDQLDGGSGLNQAVLVVDGREPLKLTAKGQGYLDDLKSRSGRFSIETLDFEQYATLDAFEGVVGLARAKDLEAVLPNGSRERISEDEVYESHHRLGRYLTPPVLCRLVGKCTATPTPECPGVDRQRILEATYAQLALNLGLTTVQLTHWWIEHQQPKPPERCHAHLHAIFKEVVLQMHDEGKVFATAVNDYFMVLPRKLIGSGP